MRFRPFWQLLADSVKRNEDSSDISSSLVFSSSVLSSVSETIHSYLNSLFANNSGAFLPSTLNLLSIITNASTTSMLKVLYPVRMGKSDLESTWLGPARVFGDANESNRGTRQGMSDLLFAQRFDDSVGERRPTVNYACPARQRAKQSHRQFKQMSRGQHRQQCVARDQRDGLQEEHRDWRADSRV